MIRSVLFQNLKCLGFTAHPSVKVFLSQCGLQSTEEAVARELPIVGIPFIADQEMNAQRLEENGVGKNIDFTSMTKENLKKALIDVAENKELVLQHYSVISGTGAIF